MSYLIDTCALSEFTKASPSPSVDAWFAQLPEGTDFASVLTLGELEKGISKLKSGKKRASLERWAAALRDRFRGRILAVDEAVALEWGRISARVEAEGHPVPVIDGLIAATAIVHGLCVVTRNVADIERTGAPIINPWATP